MSASPLFHGSVGLLDELLVIGATVLLTIALMSLSFLYERRKRRAAHRLDPQPNEQPE